MRDEGSPEGNIHCQADQCDVHVWEEADGASKGRRQENRVLEMTVTRAKVLFKAARVQA